MLGTSQLHASPAGCTWRGLVLGCTKVLEMLKVHIWVEARSGGKGELSSMMLHNREATSVTWRMGISLRAQT